MASKGKRGPKTAAATPEQIVQGAVTGDARRLIPLNNGLHVYYFDPLTLRTFHLKTRDLHLCEELVKSAQLGLTGRLLVELEGFLKTSTTPLERQNWADAIFTISHLEDLVAA